ncbi:MAG: SufD family Fe-S cluster assembly protein [Clostridia bacterium]|nr:SufD family Fe-S cluster assembly protein [Clostridia bacterium]
MNKITEKMLKIITDYGNLEKSSYNIRENGECVGRRSTKNVSIEPLFDRSGIEIKVKPNTKGETVYIPACLTKSGVNDLVYNDFYIGENSDVTIVAGCAVHTDGENESLHNGIHRFFLGKNSKVIYLEKHIGEGDGDGARKIDPVTEIELDEGASITLDTLQISGVDYSNRKTRAKLAAKAKMLVRERIMTDRDEEALTDFEVELNGEDSGVDIISRSVAKGNSYQGYSSRIIGRTRCTGHSECDAILSDNGRVDATPSLTAESKDASLIHEAAIGKIAGEQIIKLCSLGLTEEEAERKIIEGFLK